MTQETNASGLPKLVVMLTHNDYTVSDAAEIFRESRDADAEYWGMKEKPLPFEEMKRIYDEMREAGKKTVLETVAYDESAGMEGARLAARCGCDLLMGTRFHRPIADFCNDHGIAYLPFIGTIEGRPSVLTGSMEEILDEAARVVEAGAAGVDLLGYRYTGDAEALNKAVTELLQGRVCIAGNVDSYRRLDHLREISPALFTIGGAFFENRFDGTFPEQINKVCAYLRSPR